MRRITWQIVALAAVILLGVAAAIGMVAWLAPDYLTATITLILGYGMGEARAGMKRRPAEVPADPAPAEDVVPWRGES